MVERFFRDLTENRLRRGVFRSVLELIDALDDAKATDILAKVIRAKSVALNLHSV
jgi:hypothetical protein